MIRKSDLMPVLEEAIDGNVYFLVDVKVTSDNDISVFVERHEGDMTLDDCVSVSRAVESRLDREKEDFSLTVSSAGLDRPFVVPEQYRKATGSMIDILLSEGSKIRCTVISADEEGFEASYETMVQQEGKKRKVKQQVQRRFLYNEVKSARPCIVFK